MEERERHKRRHREDRDRALQQEEEDMLKNEMVTLEQKLSVQNQKIAHL